MITTPLPCHRCDRIDLLTDDQLCAACEHWADRPMPPSVVRAHRASVARAARNAQIRARRPRPAPPAPPPLSAQEHRAALAGGPVAAQPAQNDSAPVVVDPTGRGWATVADAIRDTRRGAA